MTTTFTPACTAVLVIDMQNDNLHPDGAFAASGAAAHATSQDVVRNVRAVLDAARAAGIAVFHNRIVVHPGRAVGGTNAPIFRMLGPESLKIGSWGAAIVDVLDPRPDELVLDRMRMSAFDGSSLDPMLRNLGVTDVVVVGVWTNMAVEHTVRDAADLGYRVTVVSDATSSINEDWQRAALGYALTNISTIADTASVSAAFTAAAEAVQSDGPLISRADVPTATPERYAKQLVSHLGHKISFATEGAISTAVVGAGAGQVIVGDGVLTLLATGADEQAVGQVEHVLGSHLERFAQRDELAVTWTRSAVR